MAYHEFGLMMNLKLSDGADPTTCSTDTDLFKIMCNDARLTVTLNEGCLLSDDSHSYLRQDFSDAFYVSSMKDGSSIDHEEVDHEDCKMKYNEEADLYFFQFTIENWFVTIETCFLLLKPGF